MYFIEKRNKVTDIDKSLFIHLFYYRQKLQLKSKSAKPCCRVHLVNVSLCLPFVSSKLTLNKFKYQLLDVVIPLYRHKKQQQKTKPTVSSSCF